MTILNPVTIQFIFRILVNSSLPDGQDIFLCEFVSNFTCILELSKTTCNKTVAYTVSQ